ncbi:MAG: hypothetical protein JWM67_635 [Mycobacterium sp.]|nr:hypothetical protein [Mycobacterium sp.]
MLTAMAVVLVGCACAALGLVEPTMYDIALVVIFVGLIGVAERLVDWLRWFRG